MSDSAYSKFREFCQYPVFNAVGSTLTGDASPVRNWENCVSLATSQKWENCRYMARNVLWRKTETASWERGAKWEITSKLLFPQIDRYLDDEVLRKIPLTEKSRQALRPHLAWDIYFICIEHESADLFNPPFYLPHLDVWYATGHFPCGWDGEEFPDAWDGVIRSGRPFVF